MNRVLLAGLIGLLFPIVTPCQQADSTLTNQVLHVMTALNHVTVFEFHEPVTLAASGSSDFQIERESNKVFVKPVKSGVATDLFVWTATRRFTYELETTEELKTMNFTIDSSSPQVPKAIPSTDADHVADVLLVNALLRAEEITPPQSKSAKRQISVMADQVLRTRSTTYIHYRISNTTNRAYHVTPPQARQLQPDSARVVVAHFLHSQLDSSMQKRLASIGTSPLPVPNAESESSELDPGTSTQGVLAIRRDLPSPAVIELEFGEGVKIVVVL